MDKKKIYIAGKVTGLKVHEVVMKFGAAQKKYESKGYEVVNPLAVVNDWCAPWYVAMGKCLNALCMVDEVVFLTCWQDSRGALIEHDVAKAMGKKLHYE